MKSSFVGFYSPTEQEFSKLWKECIFVLDANILLNLYRYPILARNDFISVLEKIKKQLWIPHQVGIEYQRNRLIAIDNSHKKISESLKNVTNAINSIKDNIKVLKIDERGLDVPINDVTDFLESADQKIIEVIRKVQKSQLEQLDISHTDPIRDKIDELLDGRVGVCPANEEELKSLTLDGESRYENQIPPGFQDAEKKNTYHFNGLKFDAKFGDLILWRQLINYARDKELKKIIFVTSDVKEDWWSIDKDRNSMPQPELIAEIKRLAGVDQFWMYSSEQFIKSANKYLKTNVSEQTLIEVKNASSANDDAQIPNVLDYFKGLNIEHNIPHSLGNYFVDDPVLLADAVKQFHSENAYFSSYYSNTVLIQDNNGKHFYFYRKYNEILADNIIDEAFSRYGNMIFDESSSFNMVIVVNPTNNHKVNYLSSLLNLHFINEEKRFNIKFQRTIVGYFGFDKFNIIKTN